MAGQVASQCRELLIQCAATEAASHPCSPTERCIILSGGVDTCCVLEACKLAGISFGAAITVFTSATATDRPYACAIAQQHGLQHHVIDVTLEELMAQTLPLCVRQLQTFDGMELRNSMVVAAALQRAAALGFKQAWTGDAADEMLGGYSFTWRSEEPKWSESRAKMCAEWTFAAPVLAASLGLSAHSLFMRPDFTQWALREADRAACIGEMPIELAPGEERIMHITGKLPLRRAFCDEALSAWRRKDPIEVGSGSTRLSQDDFWEAQVPADELAGAQAHAKECDGVVLRNREHLVYYREFQKQFPDGVPGRARHADLPCVGCGYQLKHKTALFCHVCGAWPAQELGSKDGDAVA